MDDRTASPAPAILLVEPQLGENIGMAARAMLNCGLRELRLVAPRDGWPNPAARDAAVGAAPIVDAARLYEGVREAVADLHRVYATTCRPRSVARRILTPRAVARELHRAQAEATQAAPIRCGILFGAERTGLRTADLAACDGIIEVPLAPDYPSLNLAGAVLIVAYEWHLTGIAPTEVELDRKGSPPATRAQFDALLEHLIARLEAGGFFRTAELKPTVVDNLRALFRRADPSEQEVRTLRGVVRALELAGERRRSDLR